MKNPEVANILAHMALYLHMDDVPFKPQAYERAATAVESLSQDVEELYKTEGLKGLEKIPGVGKGIAERIEEHLKTGKVQDYEAYRKKYPIDLDELSLVEGLGPKSIKELYEKLKVRDLKGLEQAAKGGQIRKLPHFGEKSEQNILQAIEFVKRSQGRWLLGAIYPYVEELILTFQHSKLVKQAVAAGSIRRMKETVGDVDMLVTTKTPEKVIEFFLSYVKYDKLWGRGPTKVSVHTLRGFNIDVRVLPEEVFGAGLQYFTGSKEHNVKLRTLALQKGYKLSEYGLFKGEKRVACETEEEIYKVLGMQYIEPELREDTGEIEAALRLAPLAQGLPALIPYGSLQGDLQIQTKKSKG
ncbi:MAG: DNA polymerase (family X) [Parcubacteria group bacterium Greene1014_47]|nr:MAG: DNA polymerase (family X) [Parcubacteria group bacterium Greene1014_47]